MIVSFSLPACRYHFASTPDAVGLWTLLTERWRWG